MSWTISGDPFLPMEPTSFHLWCLVSSGKSFGWKAAHERLCGTHESRVLTATQVLGRGVFDGMTPLILLEASTFEKIWSMQMPANIQWIISLHLTMKHNKLTFRSVFSILSSWLDADFPNIWWHHAVSKWQHRLRHFDWKWIQAVFLLFDFSPKTKWALDLAPTATYVPFPVYCFVCLYSAAAHFWRQRHAAKSWKRRISHSKNAVCWMKIFPSMWIAIGSQAHPCRVSLPSK